MTMPRKLCIKDFCRLVTKRVIRLCFITVFKSVIGHRYGFPVNGKRRKDRIAKLSVDLTPDLHSMGQYIQDGIRMLQETVVFFDNSRTSVTVPSDEENLDGLNYLAGREMSYINEKAMQATKAAHISGGVPVTEIRLPEIGEEALGALIYFFEFACGVSGYMEGVNPFNQPGVEAYKKNMFHLLGKPGY